MIEPKLGRWLPAYDNPLELGVAVVDLAIEHGYDILLDVWEQDKPIFLKGSPTKEMLEDLQFLADFALQYLEEQLPEGFVFAAGAEGLFVEKKI